MQQYQKSQLSSEELGLHVHVKLTENEFELF